MTLAVRTMYHSVRGCLCHVACNICAMRFMKGQDSEESCPSMTATEIKIMGLVNACRLSMLPFLVTLSVLNKLEGTKNTLTLQKI